jgi:hypothetical protein
MSYTISVNGTDHTVDTDGDTPLLWMLRDVLQMTGTKFGCGMALCGACTVHRDGVAVRACVTPIQRVGLNGASLRGSRVSGWHRSAPGRWAHTDHAAKYSTEMRLVAQPARDRKLGERLPRCLHHLACKLDAQPGYVVKGSNTDTNLKRSKKLSYAHLDESCKYHRGDFVRQVGLDVVEHAVQLPR